MRRIIEVDIEIDHNTLNRDINYSETIFDLIEEAIGEYANKVDFLLSIRTVYDV